jgi:hypothetical protein
MTSSSSYRADSFDDSRRLAKNSVAFVGFVDDDAAREEATARGRRRGER